MNNTENIITELENICISYALDSPKKLIETIKQKKNEKFIEIAVLGQFKAGKSSFINSFIGKEVLPTGVIPVTSVITRITYGDHENVTILFNDGQTKKIHLHELKFYISETENPENIKGVKCANVEIPEMKPLLGFRFIDTPGLGSVFQNNTQTTLDWAPEATIVLVCISAERPLSDADITLIETLKKYSYKIFFLITKADLFSKEQLQEIYSFIENSIKNILIKTPEIYFYSIKQNTKDYHIKLYNEIFTPIFNSFQSECENIFSHKINTIAKQCYEFLLISKTVSLKNEEEKKLLKEKIFDEKLKLPFIVQELNLITSEYKSSAREFIFKKFEPHIANIITDLQSDFLKDFDRWKGNLSQITEMFKKWLYESLSSKLHALTEDNKNEFNNKIQEINEHYGFFCWSLLERLKNNVKNLLGVTITNYNWKPDFKTLNKTDISVYRVFDTHIDMLWFLIPMFIFRKVFKKHFYNQIETEIEKNIHRLVSDINKILSREIDSCKEQTLNYLYGKIKEIENALNATSSKLNEYDEVLEKLNGIISQSETKKG